jgi:hypothetical protein
VNEQQKAEYRDSIARMRLRAEAVLRALALDHAAQELRAAQRKPAAAPRTQAAPHKTAPRAVLASSRDLMSGAAAPPDEIPFDEMLVRHYQKTYLDR